MMLQPFQAKGSELMVGRQYVHGSRGIWNAPVNPDRKPWVKEPIEVDCHKTQKAARDAARTNPGGKPVKKKPKPSKAERKAEKAARAKLKSAPKKIEVEHRSGGVVVKKRIINRPR
jgi:hypothetical protein